MTVDQASKCAEMLQAIAEPNRLLIIQCLLDGPKNVTDLHKMLSVAIVNVSHHLGVLKKDRLVQAEKKGRFVFYSLNPEFFNSLDSRTYLNLGKCRVEFCGDTAVVNNPVS